MPPPSKYHIPALPLEIELETLPIYKALADAKAALAELKGVATAIPNQRILIDTLALQEAKASSEIENIVTTQDDLLKGVVAIDGNVRGSVKDVSLYRDAMDLGWRRLKKTGGVIQNTTLIKQYQLLKGRNDAFQGVAGTVLKDNIANIGYVPPQSPDSVMRHMTALEHYINNDLQTDLDPLIKMTVIHHQFESINPFSDANGRIGRMLNVLYLCQSGLLDQPILYLSRTIKTQKTDYYTFLQKAPDASSGLELQNAWQDWVLFMLSVVRDASRTVINLFSEIRKQMTTIKRQIRDGDLKKIYSQDLLNNLFRHPYTRVEFIEQELGVSRPTATKYLKALVRADLLEQIRQGRNNYHVNRPLVSALTDVGGR
ncbi:MAG: Fic/DOC family N-terminal domain-containing protein [Pseudomonadota bacterium]